MPLIFFTFCVCYLLFLAMFDRKFGVNSVQKIKFGVNSV